MGPSLVWWGRWKGEFRIEYKERHIYSHISKFLSLPQIIALTGLRRAGKTTIMLKLVEDCLKNGFESNILYFPFDEFREIEIRELLREYEQLVERDIGQGKFLLLFDEIQKLKNREDQLKRIYDLYGRNTKIVIAGSESLFIRKKSKESLAGRILSSK